jgi:tetratricopeptide (TPR) repeat protein
VLSERGIVGGVLFFGFLLTCLGAGLWERFRNLSAEGKGQAGAMVAAIAYWFVHSSAEWFWQLPAVTLPAIVYLAMLAAPWRRVEAAPLRWRLRAVGAGVALLAVAAVIPLYAADRYMAQSYSTTDPGEALMAVERAQRFNPLSPEISEREAELAVDTGDRGRAEDALREATRLNPEHYAQYVFAAQLYELGGDPEAALSYYRQALALNPLDPTLNRRTVTLLAQAPVRERVLVRFVSGPTELGRLNLTVANNAPELEGSLQGSAALPPDGGLLFVWPESTEEPFWLNTTVPLDIAFITSYDRTINNEGLEEYRDEDVYYLPVTNIRPFPQPNTAAPITLGRPYDLAVVANRGFFENNNIEPQSQTIKSQAIITVSP